jgi:hypothetical protein
VVGALQATQSQQRNSGETGLPSASTEIVLAPLSEQITISVTPPLIVTPAFNAAP